MDFEIAVDDKTAPDYEMADNAAENLVDVIRSDMVGNEGPFLALNATYATGLFPDPSHYNMTIVRGKSGEGKSELKGNVDALWRNKWMLKAGSASDQGFVDDDRWNDRYILSAAEFQQMQGKMLEMIKSSAGDDADEDGVGFRHNRNVDDGDGGRTSDEKKKQTMPVVFLFADENNAEIPRELATRMMTIRVEADAEINAAVIDTMFDHKEVSVPGRDHQYNYNFTEGKNRVKNHLANIPRPVTSDMIGPSEYARPVVLPYDDNRAWPINDHPDVDSAGWDVARVMKPIFNPNKPSSKRAGKAVANHIRAWTLLNYHNREIIDIDGREHYVAEPQDLANVLAYRDLLLNVTHDINEQKLAVIEALTDPDNGVGAPGPNGGYQAPHKDIRGYIEEYASVTSLSKYQLVDSEDSILSQMEQDYLIEVHEGEGPQGAHMYEFLGGNAFGHPNLELYPDLFDEHTTDPIRDQPITTTVEDFAEKLSTQTAQDLMDEDPNETVFSQGRTDDTAGERESLSDFSDDDDADDYDWSEVDTAVHERLQDTLDDKRATQEAVDDIAVAHMVGVAPVEYYHDDRGMDYVRPERPFEEADRHDTILSSEHHLWGDKSDGGVDSAVHAAIGRLREADIFEIHTDGDDPYFVVSDL